MTSWTRRWSRPCDHIASSGGISHSNCSHYENFLFIPQNKATLFWVQVTQIFKERAKECISEKWATCDSTALHCLFLIIFLSSPLWPVAPDSGACLLLQIIKAHCLSLFCHCIITRPDRSRPLSCSVLQLKVLQWHRTTCSSSKLPAGGDTTSATTD